MKEYIQVMWLSAVVVVTAQIIFFGGSLQPGNLILWTTIGAVLGAINKSLELLFRDSEPKPSLVDKIVGHPVLLMLNGIVTVSIVGTSIGGYAGNEVGGCVIGGIIGGVLVALLVVKDRELG